jgi:hypothetical protein
VEERGGGTLVESRIQYSMHRRAVCVAAGTSRPDNSNPEILVERFLRHPGHHREETQDRNVKILGSIAGAERRHSISFGPTIEEGSRASTVQEDVLGHP